MAEAPQAETESLEETLSKSDIHERWWSDYFSEESKRFQAMAIDKIVQTLDPPPGATILDAGCGSGEFATRFGNHGLNVQGIDFSADAITEARQRVASAGLQDKIALEEGNLLELQFPDGTFEYAFCWGVLMHIAEVEKAISELARVVRPGGVLVVSEINARSVEALLIRGLRRLLGRTPKRRVDTEAGLEIWYATPAGELLARQSYMPGLIGIFERYGLELEKRIAGEFSESYVRVSPSFAKKTLHAWNRFWFRFVGLPQPAFANLLFFRKVGDSAAKD